MKIEWCWAAVALLAAGCGTTGSSGEDFDGAESRWTVHGRVTDAEGRGLAGVEVHANCGAGTLLRTGTAVSDGKGRYTLDFGPGMRRARDAEGSWETAVQAASIFASLQGYTEANLCRQGDLYLAHRAPEAQVAEGSWGATDSLVLAGAPRRVDFQMVPAAMIRGTIVDGKGEPIANAKVWVVGDELPPSSSVLASIVTDDEGGFECAGIPPRYFWRLTVDATHPEAGAQTKSWFLAKAGCFELDLELRSADDGATTLRILRGPKRGAR